MKLGLALVVVLAACASSSGPGAGGARRGDGVYAQVYTTKGYILARLEPDLTPLAVANFVGLAEGTIENAALDPGRPFYDGTVYHRVVPGHVIQTGVPRGGRANGPGYTFPNEIHARLSHDHAGALNMANGGPHTNGAQWCITLGDRSYLDGDYIVFGDVVDGLDVVMSIVQGDVVDSVRILRIGKKAQAYRPNTQSFRAQRELAEQRVAEHVVKKRLAEEEWIARNYRNLSGSADGLRTAQLSAGTGAKPVGPFRVRYRGTKVRYMGHLLGYNGPALEATTFGSTEVGIPAAVDEPAVFTYEPGKTRVNPGFDRVVGEMAVGERRVVIVPAALGYGRAGLYTPEIPGIRRFVISPNTLLVYEIEILSDGRSSR